MRLLSLFAITVAAVAQPPQQQYVPSGKPGTLEGTVTDQVTHAPVRKATVTVTNMQGNYSFVGVTDSQGKFHVDSADPGKYMVTNATAQGYQYDHPRQGNSVFNVNEEEHVTGIKVEMTPYGVINGKVVDDEGEPMRDVAIQALTYFYGRGARRVSNAASANTDDRGEFRLFDLQPGRYLIRASVQPRGGAVFLNTDLPLPPNTHIMIPETGYPVTFYPNVADTAQATLVKVTPGSVSPGIDFQMHSAPVYHIRGKVTGLGQGRGQVAATDCGHGEPSVQEMDYSATPDQDGLFDIAGLASGTYCLSVGYIGRSANVFARQTVTVSDRSLDGVVLAAQNSNPISGVVTVDNQSAPPPRMRLNLQPTEGGRNYGSPVTDGKFEFGGVVPDAYQLIVAGLPNNFYLKSMQYGSQDVSSGTIPVKGDGGVLSLVLGTDGGNLSGTVQNESGDPAAAVEITVAPDDSLASRPDLLKIAATDMNGSFQVRGLAPGNYKVYAWEDHDLRGLASMADFRKEFSSYAAAVVISPGATANVQVKSIPAKESAGIKERFQ